MNNPLDIHTVRIAAIFGYNLPEHEQRRRLEAVLREVSRLDPIPEPPPERGGGKKPRADFKGGIGRRKRTP